LLILEASMRTASIVRPANHVRSPLLEISAEDSVRTLPQSSVMAIDWKLVDLWQWIRHPLFRDSGMYLAM